MSMLTSNTRLAAFISLQLLKTAPTLRLSSRPRRRRAGGAGRGPASGEEPARPKPFRQRPDAYAHAVADQVAPQEPEAQHQPADPHPADAVYPGCAVELADFDGETKEAGRRRDTPDRE